MANVEKDALTGTDTTGHVWDGIRELNTPLPTWWLWTFYACIVWAIAYVVLMPALPGWNGLLGYDSRENLANELESVKQERSAWLGKFEGQDINSIAQDNELMSYAMAGGKFIFNENCAPCHGAGGQGNPDYPVLADDDWLWGGTLDAIETTIRYGVRSGHADARFNEMPHFVRDELLTSAQVNAVADYVLSLSGQGAGSAEGKTLFEEQCIACHGEGGAGLPDMGGPNLTDGIWLYGGTKEAVVSQMMTPKHGVMPTWEGRLDDASIKQVAIYVHTLGGGQ